MVCPRKSCLPQVLPTNHSNHKTHFQEQIYCLSPSFPKNGTEATTVARTSFANGSFSGLPHECSKSESNPSSAATLRPLSSMPFVTKQTDLLQRKREVTVAMTKRQPFLPSTLYLSLETTNSMNWKKLCCMRQHQIAYREPKRGWWGEQNESCRSC